MIKKINRTHIGKKKVVLEKRRPVISKGVHEQTLLHHAPVVCVLTAQVPVHVIAHHYAFCLTRKLVQEKSNLIINNFVFVYAY